MNIFKKHDNTRGYSNTTGYVTTEGYIVDDFDGLTDYGLIDRILRGSK